MVVTNAAEVSECYSVSNRVCFYTSDSNDLMLNWSDAREFCEARNSTLPTITDEKIDNVFQRFIATEAYNVIQSKPVWLDAHARPVENSAYWHWINGSSSGTL